MNAAQVRRIGRLGPAGLALLLIAAPAIRPPYATAADPRDELERRVKAAFLYKFSGYVEWPTGSFPRPDTPISIGIAGDRRLATDLTQTVVGRTSWGRTVTVTSLEEPGDVRSLHVLFIARSESARLKEWTDALRGAPVLVVTESEGALDLGSMINLINSEGRVRFEVAVGPAQTCGLRLSSRLLAVARSVVHPTR